MLRVMSLIAIVLIAEIIFFGPLGLPIYEYSLRKSLIVILVGCSIVPLLSQPQIATWQISFLLGVALFAVVWAGIVPIINGVDLKLSLAEVQPLSGLLLILPLYFLFQYDSPKFYFNIIAICTFFMALAVIFVWAATNIFNSYGTGIAFRDFYIALNDNVAGVYIGPLPDGSFRVMLINFIIFPLMVAYYNWEKTNIGWSAFYALATFATGTRAFLLVVALIVGVSLLRNRPLLGIIIATTISSLAVVYASNLQGLRTFELSSELQSSSSRYTQFFSLMALFWEHPVFGAGFGASAAVIRSFEAPYSYELTYVALLAKLGLVGSGLLILIVGWWTVRLMRGNPNWMSIGTLLIAFVFMTATNPYLINSVGITIVAVIIVVGVSAGNAVPRSKLRPTGSRAPSMQRVQA